MNIKLELLKVDERFGQEEPYMWSTYILPNGHFLNPDNYLEGEPDFGWAYEHEDFDDNCDIALYKYCMKMNVTWPYISLPEESEWTVEQQKAFKAIIDKKDYFEPDISIGDVHHTAVDSEYAIKMREPLLVVTTIGDKIYDLAVCTADYIIRDIKKALIRKQFDSEFRLQEAKSSELDIFTDTLGKNRDGSLKIFYHGTNSNIKGFDSEWPVLTWFADDKEYVSEAYNANVISAYLNYKKPLTIVDYDYAYVYPVLEAEYLDIETPLDRFSLEMYDLLKELNKTPDDLKKLIAAPSSADQVDSFRKEAALGELTITAIANTPMFKQWMIGAGFDALIAPDGNTITIGIVNPKNIYVLSHEK